MRRCFIAIFALHFFLSVSAFAFGGWATDAAPGMPAAALVQSELPAEAPEPGTAEALSSHALVDEVPDLPDSLPRTLSMRKPPVDGGPAIAYRQRSAPPPSLDGLLRPPQRASLPA